MEDNNNYILLYSREKNTIEEFMSKEYIYGITPKELFSDNEKFIFTQMNLSDKQNFKTQFGSWPKVFSDLRVDMYLPVPCNLKVNPNKVSAEVAINQTNLQTNTADFYSFAFDAIQQLLQNEGYVSDYFTKRDTDCFVFGWFKSLYFTGGGKKNKISPKEYSEFSNLSRFIVSLTTNVDKNGGNFTIKLPMVSAESASNLILKNSDNDVTGQFGRATKNSFMKNFDNNQFYSKNDFGASGNNNYFNWLISSNDLIFISFEKLQMETNRSEKLQNSDDDNFDINTNIASGVYDMIGLVDEVKVVTDAQTCTSHVEIQGRDLMKLLIDDGSFFFNPSISSESQNVFSNMSGKHGDIRDVDYLNNSYNNPLKRLRYITGEIDIFKNKVNQNIDYILKGVISKLANIEVIPDYVFDSWGKDRTSFNDLKSK